MVGVELVILGLPSARRSDARYDAEIDVPDTESDAHDARETHQAQSVAHATRRGTQSDAEHDARDA